MLDYLFHEEFLWQRTNHSVSLIKQFCIELIKQKLCDNENMCETSFTLELLECIHNIILILYF